MNQSGLHGRSAKGFVEVAHLGMFFSNSRFFFSKSLLIFNGFSLEFWSAIGTTFLAARLESTIFGICFFFGEYVFLLWLDMRFWLFVFEVVSVQAPQTSSIQTSWKARSKSLLRYFSVRM